MAAQIHQLPASVPQIPNSASLLPRDGLRWRIVTGLVVAASVVFGIGGWAATAQLSGAVIATGVVVVDSNIKKVQHPTGGVVGEIRVKTGSRVKAGDIVLRLDDTQTRASLGVIQSQLTELTGRRARLAAERDAAETVVFPIGFAQSNPEAQRVAKGEQRLFRSKRDLLRSQKAQLTERVGQLREGIRGLSVQRDAKARELDLVRQELARVLGMYQKRLTPVTRVLAMQREEVRIAGEHGALISQIAGTKGQITETVLQSLSLDQTAQNEAQQELREVEAKIAELKERRIAAVDQLKRVDIVAPRAGVVHDLNVHTIGGVISPGEPIMLIVPNEDRLTIEARISPSDIDQVSVGQKTMLRFSAFNQRKTPELAGRVVRVGADLSRDPQSVESFYVLRIKADEKAIEKIGGLSLVPGMPVEAFIQTGDRTALSYIVKPLNDQIARAFREE